MTPTVESFLEKGNKAMSEKQYLQARTAYEDALRLSPDDPKIFAKISLAAYKLKDMPGAIEMMSKAVELSPRDADLLVGLGHLYIKAGDKTKAITVCEKLRKIHPEKGEALYKDIYA